jgi:hypothetical protein
LENIVTLDQKNVNFKLATCPNLVINNLDLDSGPDPESPKSPDPDPIRIQMNMILISVGRNIKTKLKKAL